jgi:hypothetical protein
LKCGETHTDLTKGNEIMKAISMILLALSMTTVHAATPEVQVESCDQIREQIQAHTGIPASPAVTCPEEPVSFSGSPSVVQRNQSVSGNDFGILSVQRG